ncbi:MAG: hypothetical protein KAW41_01945 [Candidatus Diapherotrites archaeon]|nr:hypothetical protein [Candidatus Diapherotrites archaeon]
MVPEKELIKREYTVRGMRLPNETKLTRQSLLRWLCLSLGLLSPDESRQSVLPIMDSFLELQFSGQKPTVAELSEKSGQPEKAVRYHMHRLMAMGLAQEEKRHYSFVLDSSSDSLSLPKTFREHYAESLLASLFSIEGALKELQRSYEG